MADTGDAVEASAPPAVAEKAPEDALRELKEKTAKWKKVVKAQLEEAAAKNEKLREELAKARGGADAAAAEVRLQLTQEFKERTQAKDDENAALRAKVADLGAQLRAQDERHTAELQERERIAQQQADAAAQHADAVAESKLEQLRTIHQAELAKVERKCDALRSENKDLDTRLQDAMRRLEAAGAGGAASDAEVAALREQVAALKAEAGTQRAQAASEIQRWEQSAAQLSEKQDAQFRAELARRDEQLHVTQAMLAQARDELTATVSKVHRIQAAAAHEVESAERRAATLANQLSAKVAETTELQAALDRAKAESTRLTQDLADARIEAASREAAFNELFERGQAQDEQGPLLAAKVRELELRLREAEATAESAAAALKAAEAAAASQREEAEAAVAQRDKHAAQREAQLHDLERRLADQKRRLAEEAQRLQRAYPAPKHAQDDGDGGVGVTSTLEANLRLGRLYWQTQSATVASKVKRFWPLVIVALLLVSFFAVAPSGGAVPTATQAEALGALQKRYSSTVDQLLACQASLSGGGTGSAKAAPAGDAAGARTPS